MLNLGGIFTCARFYACKPAPRSPVTCIKTHSGPIRFCWIVKAAARARWLKICPSLLRIFCVRTSLILPVLQGHREFYMWRLYEKAGKLFHLSPWDASSIDDSVTAMKQDFLAEEVTALQPFPQFRRKMCIRTLVIPKNCNEREVLNTFLFQLISLHSLVNSKLLSTSVKERGFSNCT